MRQRSQYTTMRPSSLNTCKNMALVCPHKVHLPCQVILDVTGKKKKPKVEFLDETLENDREKIEYLDDEMEEDT